MAIGSSRIGSGDLGARSGNSGAISRGSRIGEGGLGARAGDSGAIYRGARGGGNISQGRPVGEGGLGARSGDSGAINRGQSTITQGQRVGAGGLGARSGNSGAINRGQSTISRGQRVGEGGLGARFGNSGAISRGGSVGDGGLGGGSLSRGGGSLSSGGGLSKQGENSSFGNYTPSSSLSDPSERDNGGGENFREIRCGGPITGELNLYVVQDFNSDTGMIKAADAKNWKAVTDGKDWTPENWQLCTPYRKDYSDNDNEDQIGNWSEPTIDGAESSSVEIILDLFSDGCFVMLDQPDPNGKIVSRNLESRSCTEGKFQEVDITPSLKGGAVFVNRNTLTF